MTPADDRTSRVDPRHADIFSAGALGVLTTLTSAGRPQMSPVNYACDVGSATFRVSVTASRAKVKNLRRDPRASILVYGESQWQYAVGEGTARLGDVATSPDDAATDALVDLYRTLAGEHPDWDDYRRAMVADQRLVLTITLERSYGAG